MLNLCRDVFGGKNNILTFLQRISKVYLLSDSIVYLCLRTKERIQNRLQYYFIKCRNIFFLALIKDMHVVFEKGLPTLNQVQ